MKGIIKFFLLTLCLPAFAQEPSIVLVIPSYNNIEWYQKNLDSLTMQSNDHWTAIYIDDCSTDGTSTAVKEYIHDKNLAHKIQYVRNEQRRGALYGIYNAVHSCANNAIVVTLDGDDWFAHEHVLERIYQEYAHKNVWLTYGMYQVYPDNTIGAGRSIPKEITAKNTHREHAWYATHLRTFYAWLFKKIAVQDLLYQGSFLPVTWDMAFMFPMLEMAGKHARHIPEILYIYNQANVINDYKVRLPLVLQMDKFIRGKKKYEPLSKVQSNLD